MNQSFTFTSHAAHVVFLCLVFVAPDRWSVFGLANPTRQFKFVHHKLYNLVLIRLFAHVVFDLKILKRIL